MDTFYNLLVKEALEDDTVTSKPAPPPADEAPIERLYGAIRRLSEIDRGVILLYLEEKSYREIAEITGTNANNVGVRIKRIKERLRRILDGQVD